MIMKSLSGGSMLIFSTKGKITPADDKTNIVHKFTVPENTVVLKIKYQYSPKTLPDREKAVNIIHACFERYEETLQGRPADFLPVKNLVTLSLDCMGEYRGAAHRQDNIQEHIIAPGFASPGFIKAPVRAGEWDVVLNVHSISCDVEYSINIEGENAQ